VSQSLPCPAPGNFRIEICLSPHHGRCLGDDIGGGPRPEEKRHQQARYASGSPSDSGSALRRKDNWRTQHATPPSHRESIDSPVLSSLLSRHATTTRSGYPAAHLPHPPFTKHLAKSSSTILSLTATLPSFTPTPLIPNVVQYTGFMSARSSNFPP
jgi:hypothetical protein